MSRVHARRLKQGWQVDFTYRNTQGKMVRYRRLLGKTKKEAEERGRELKRQADSLGYVPDEQDFVATREDPLPMWRMLNIWFDTHVKLRNSPSEIANKTAMLKDHIGPFFGAKDIRDVNPTDCARFQAKLATHKRYVKKTKTYVTMSNARNNKITATVRTFFNWAVRMGYVDKSPMNAVRPLPEREYEPTPMSEKEAIAFLTACEETEPFWLPFFTTACFTGMRLGELCGLKWMDVDFDLGVIHVRRSIWHGQEKAPKSGKARIVPMSDFLAEVLRQHRTPNQEFVFTAKEGGPLTRNSMRKPYDRLREKLYADASKPAPRFHDLRHSFATQLMVNRIPTRVVQKLLGHSDIRMTARYETSPDDEMKKAVNGLLAGLAEQKICQRPVNGRSKRGYLRVV